MIPHASPFPTPSPTASQRGVLSELTAMYLVFTTALVYLEVPLRHALLLAFALVTQACLGVLVITRLLKGVLPSLLLLCGPGLILGGGLSFAIFQISGRGALGVIATISVNVTVLFVLARKAEWKSAGPCWWTLGQLLGLSALALISEFAELLPIAILFFVVGFLFSPVRPISRPIFVLALSISIIVIAATFVTRQEYWWLVTDDYLYFDVISRHITTAGPFADWGAANFGRYHWLSYGWAGLLDLLGGSPQPLVTLTRVMPLVYSMTMVASLTLLNRHIRRQVPSMGDMIPVWLVVVLAEIDWSGTSTAGAYAVLAAFLYILVVALDSPRFRSRALVLLGVFFIILLLTKFPTIFVVVLALLTATSVQASRQLNTRWAKGVALSAGLGVSALATIGVLLVSSVTVGGYEFIAINPSIGQLAETGLIFSQITLLLHRLPLWILVALLAYRLIRGSLQSKSATSLIPGIFLALLFGSALELVVAANGDNYRYFSGPMYFFTAISALLASGDARPIGDSARDRLCRRLVISAVLIWGVAWNRLNINQEFWNSLGPQLVSAKQVEQEWLRIELLRYYTSLNSRFGATIGLLVIAGSIMLWRRMIPFGQILMVSLVILAFYDGAENSFRDFRTSVTKSDLDSGLGSDSAREISVYLRNNSSRSDLIATNHLVNSDGSELSDYSLATWSQREFLVLGPRFFRGSASMKEISIDLSLSFAESPSPESCTALRDAGVRWFIINLDLTSQREWKACASEEIAVGNFLLLSLK